MTMKEMMKKNRAARLQKKVAPVERKIVFAIVDAKIRDREPIIRVIDIFDSLFDAAEEATRRWSDRLDIRDYFQTGGSYGVAIAEKCGRVRNARIIFDCVQGDDIETARKRAADWIELFWRTENVE